MNVQSLRRTALVAGGAGFVGSHLCDALVAQGYRVTCLDNLQTGRADNVLPLRNTRGFRLLETDVATDPLPDERFDVIFNLASPASSRHYQADPVRTLMTNVVGTNRLLALAERHGARFVQASTSAVYGDPECHPQREDDWGHVNPIGVRACYKEGKRAAEALCFDYLRAGRADVRVARIFNTYGPRMQPDDGRIVSNLIVQALNGEPLTVYGNGRQTRSFCHVSDLVRGLLAMMEVERTPPGPVNLGNPAEVAVLDLALAVQRMIPNGSRIVFCPLPADDPRRRRPDITRAREVLGWSPQVPLARGLAETAGWFRLHGRIAVTQAQKRPAE